MPIPWPDVGPGAMDPIAPIDNADIPGSRNSAFHGPADCSLHFSRRAAFAIVASPAGTPSRSASSSRPESAGVYPYVGFSFRTDSIALPQSPTRDTPDSTECRAVSVPIGPDPFTRTESAEEFVHRILGDCPAWISGRQVQNVQRCWAIIRIPPVNDSESNTDIAASGRTHWTASSVPAPNRSCASTRRRPGSRPTPSSDRTPGPRSSGYQNTAEPTALHPACRGSQPGQSCCAGCGGSNPELMNAAAPLATRAPVRRAIGSDRPIERSLHQTECPTIFRFCY